MQQQADNSFPLFHAAAVAAGSCRQTTVAECKAQLAILTGRRRLWDEALAWWHKVRQLSENSKNITTLVRSD